MLNTLKLRFGLDIYEAEPRELHEKLQEHGYEATLDALEESVGHTVDLLSVGAGVVCARSAR